ncbi:MAG: 4-(cytidine 5'-diphospho)-2-C-methyl-D-erythritol kinase [Pseudomonadota bacterium]
MDTGVEQLSLPAPAKINRFLHITGRRDDGYHLLQTIFQFLNFGDEILLRRRGDGEIRRCRDLDGVAEDQDLVVRAARLLQSRTGTGFGADIDVDKRLPMGGGLGGGSSDAASVLLGLNALWQCGLNEDDLAELGLALGADVPVFVRGRACWAEGVGEEITPIQIDEPWFVVLAPPVSLDTGKLFSHPGLTRDCPVRKIRGLETVAQVDDLTNVFEPVARAESPEVDAALSFLERFTTARLSGSGACVFGAFKTQDEARAVFAQRPKSTGGFVAKGCNQSPAHHKLNDSWGVAKWQGSRF